MVAHMQVASFDKKTYVHVHWVLGNRYLITLVYSHEITKFIHALISAIFSENNHWT